MPALEGVEVKVGKRAFVVPPLTLWLSERLEKPESYESARSMAELVRDMLSENYPDVTTDELLKSLPGTKKRLEAVFKSVVQAAMTDAEPAKGEAGGP